MINDTTYQTHYAPVSAWVIYELQNEDPESDKNDTRDAPQYYLEEQGMHRSATGGYQLTAAKPLTRERVRAVAEMVDDSERIARSFRHIIPTNVLSIAYQPETLVWLVKAKERNLNFSLGGLESGLANCPNLIFRVTDNAALTVYATRSGRVNAGTPLYRAPFPNISRGKVCLGSAKSWIQEHTTYEDFMEMWEEIFFDSVFNSDNDQGRAKVSMPKLWKPLMNSDAKFPVAKLLKTNLTIKNLLP